MVLQRNHDVRLAALALDSASAAVIIANAPPNPTLSVQTAGISRSRGIGSGDLRNKTFDTVVGISQLVERGGKRDLRTKNALALEDASRLDVGDAVRQQRIAASDAYFELLGSQERLRISDELLIFSEHSLAIADRRLKAGDLAASEAARVRVDDLRVRNDLSQSRADLFKAQLALALLTGAEGPAQNMIAVDPWPDLGNIINDDLADEELNQRTQARADVMAARRRTEAARFARDSALALRKSDVTVGVQYEHYPSTISNPQGSGNTVGLSIQIPLQTRYDFRGEIRNAEAALNSAQETEDKIRAIARSEIEARNAELHRSADQALRYHRDLLPSARRVAIAAEFAFSNGATGVSELLDARRTDRAIQAEAIAADAAYAKARLAWDIETSASKELHE